MSTLAVDNIQDLNGNELGLTVSANGVLAPHKNLTVKNGATPDEDMDIDADEVVVTDTSGNQIVLSSINLTVDNLVSGANGLDTGSVANSTMYFYWVVYNPSTTTTAGLMSASSSSPTMPSGYTYKGLVGACATDGTADNYVIEQYNDLVYFAQQTVTLLSAGTATSYTSFTYNSYAPALVSQIHLSGYIDSNSVSETNYALFIAQDSTDSAGVYLTGHWNGSSLVPYSYGNLWMPVVDSSGTLYYKNQGTGLSTIRLGGWRY